MGWWTASRAAGIGAVAGLAALVLWPAFAWREGFFWPFVAALALTAACGASILLLTAADGVRRRRRGVFIQRVRRFDIVFGLLLLVPAALQLEALIG